MRIRKGNDFIFLWAIERNELPEDFSNAVNIRLHFKNFDCVGEVKSFQIVDGNIVRVEVSPEWASNLGAYRLILSYEFEDSSYSDGDRKCVVDVLAFNIVPKTSEADDVAEMTKTTDIMIGLKGDKGDPFTYDDFTQQQLDDIQQPITDFVAVAEVAENKREENEDVRIDNENIRISNEDGRISNESDRVDAEIIREQQEADRQANTATAISNANTATSQADIATGKANTARDEAVIATSDARDAISETETATSDANVATGKANTATTQANTARDNANASALNADEKATLAETAAQNANNATSDFSDAEVIREQQEQARQTNTATAISNAESAITDVNAAKDDYYDVVKPDIIAQGEYATAQGDYAKAQGEAVDGRVTALEEKVDKNIGWYGVEWSTAIASSSMTRIGSMNLHRELPVQNKMKGVLLNNDGTVNKYLDENDWTSEVRDGTQGQVMVEMPEFYYKFEANGNIRRMLISDYALTGFEKMPKMYISAYEASLNGSNLSSEAGVMAKTSYSRTNFRSSARNRGDGWEMYFYNAHKSMLMLYFVEYANRNSQLNFNAQLTESGFKQGGLGAGVTTVISGEWSSYNGYNPFVECGFTDTLGNNTGVVTMDVPFGSVPTVDVPRYRGIENPFGHIWKNCDGINIDIKTDEDGGTSTCYICDDPAMFSDSSYEGYTNVGLLARSNGYINEMLLGEFMPASVGGGSTTYWADQFYTSITSSSLRTVLWGGFAYNGTFAGLGYSITLYSPSYTAAHFGSRVCFFKKRNS